MAVAQNSDEQSNQTGIIYLLMFFVMWTGLHNKSASNFKLFMSVFQTNKKLKLLK